MKHLVCVERKSISQKSSVKWPNLKIFDRQHEVYKKFVKRNGIRKIFHLEEKNLNLGKFWNTKIVKNFHLFGEKYFTEKKCI